MIAAGEPVIIGIENVFSLPSRFLMNRGVSAVSFSWGRGRIKGAAVVPVTKWPLMCDQQRLA
jgi:hypothetical protein